MADNTALPTLIGAGWHLSYMNYFATGEGHRSCLAVAGTAAAAERLLKEKLPEYFHPGIVTMPIDADADPDATAMLQWLPPAASEALRRLPRGGTGHYFAEIYYNVF